ncbi:MAG: hypothetical protein MUP21_01210 [Dehalococcoidia bacterium]|nr:hypothetical protein [Dehalococcoidia bacterium]
MSDLTPVGGKPAAAPVVVLGFWGCVAVVFIASNIADVLNTYIKNRSSARDGR